MHETSIALSILDIVGNVCRDEERSRVDVIRVKIGRASGVMTDSLLFAFDCVKEGTCAAGANLDVVEVPVGGHCAGCGSDFSVEEKYVFECPLCGDRNFSITSGHELEIMELEVYE